MPTYAFAGKCGHTWDIPYTPCNETTCPSCNCGKPYYWLGTEPGAPIVCPTCGYITRFEERPIWTHMGKAHVNMASIMKLGMYKEKPTMNLKEELRALQDAWTPPPFAEREVLTEEDQWEQLIEQCRKYAKLGCATTGYTLVTGIETQEQYDTFIAMKGRFRTRLAAEGLHMQQDTNLPWKSTYTDAFGNERPTHYTIQFVVTWR